METIWFHNINGIKDEKNWAQIILTMKENNIDIFGFAEINKSMDNFALNWWKSTIRKQFYLSRMIHSESTTKTDSEYKPGGTLTTITGKWQARVSEMGRDNKGLGRWSYIKISSKKSNLIIITAYRPCKSYGPLTAWMQQWSLLREKGIKHPDPIKIFYEDLSTEISKWTQEGAEVILMLDANEPLGERPGGLGNLVGRHSLVDLSQKVIQDEEKVSTYARGSKKIDFIFGTQRVAKHCTDSGIVPYGFGYPSDHRALFIRINIGNILNTSFHLSSLCMPDDYKMQHQRNDWVLSRQYTNTTNNKICSTECKNFEK
jgi:exonuclease III